MVIKIGHSPCYFKSRGREWSPFSIRMGRIPGNELLLVGGVRHSGHVIWNS